MYLWCSKCLHATHKASWDVKGEKYGACIICGCSEYRNAVEWEKIAALNDYPPVPDRNEIYYQHPVLF